MAWSIQMKGATVASGHEDIKKNPVAVPGTTTPAARVKPPTFVHSDCVFYISVALFLPIFSISPLQMFIDSRTKPL